MKTYQEQGAVTSDVIRALREGLDSWPNQVEVERRSKQRRRGTSEHTLKWEQEQKQQET